MFDREYWAGLMVVQHQSTHIIRANVQTNCCRHTLLYLCVPIRFCSTVDSGDVPKAESELFDL
jgi:hypothetical protein